MENLRELKAADGSPYLCSCFELYGCPIWIPLEKAESFDEQVSRVQAMLDQATKVVGQLQNIKELADQITGEFT